MRKNHSAINRLCKKLDRLQRTVEKIYIDEAYKREEPKPSKKEIIIGSLGNGIFKGLGYAVGVTILGAIVLIILQFIVANNIPIIGKFVAKILDAVESIRR